MTPPQHYAEAEHLLMVAAATQAQFSQMVQLGQAPASEALVAINAANGAAQVHATLALAGDTDPAVANPNYARDQARMGPM